MAVMQQTSGRPRLAYCIFSKIERFLLVLTRREPILHFLATCLAARVPNTLWLRPWEPFAGPSAEWKASGMSKGSTLQR